MSTNNILESKLFKAIVLSMAALIILVFVFGLGVFVGTKKADFSFRWADQYHRNFAGPQGGFFNDMAGRQFIDANGVFGEIIKIDGQTLTIKGGDNVEKIVLVGDEATVVFQKKNIKLSELKVGDEVIVIGEPDDNGQIHAKLIRVLPLPPVSLRTDVRKLNNF